MNGEHQNEKEDFRARGDTQQQANRISHSLAEGHKDADGPAYSVSLRGVRAMGPVNNSLHTSALQSMQRTHGNRAVQRSIRRDPLPEPPVPVQRDIWDLFKGGSVGDWQIKPPTWAGETDDRYDHPDNQRRAEQKEADERGYSPTPPEWWKKPEYDPKAPLPWMPKIKEMEPVEPIIIPPKPPDEKGDYPIPPWPDEEVYA